jgi:hypothetical protein
MTRFLAPLLALLLASGLSAAHAQDVAPISTDRPGFGSSTAPVGLGVLQAEIGLAEVAYFSNLDFAFISQVASLRYGVRETVELRLTTNLYDTIVGTGSSSSFGFDAFVVGAKIALPVEAVSASIQPEVIYRPDSDEVRLLVEANAGYALGEVLTTNGFAVLQTDFDGRAILLAANLAAALTPALSGYAEAGAAFSEGSDQLTIGAGLAALVNRNTQIDLGLQVPTQDAVDTFLISFGVSFRVDTR